MGVVWQAHDERLHRTVAVKQLLLQPGLSEAEAEEARQRSMREGRIAARLQHPHAIAVYDVAEADGQPWLIMEYLPSKSLSTVLAERGSLPPREVARIGTQVAAALAAAHNAGIVHRDIKPGNVLLGDDGTVKITDFGISRATGDVTVTATGMLAGTPAYLAPEIAKGYDPGPPSDVFSLGSTLYAAVEGMPPFGLNENTIALLHTVASGQITPPRQAGPLTALLMRLLRPEPNDRPTMAQAREALAAIASGRSVPDAGMGSGPVPVSPPPRQSPARPGGAAGTPATPGSTRLDSRPMGATPPPGRPSAGPARPAGATAAGSTKPNRRSALITVVAILAAAIIGILVANALNGSDSNQQNAGSGGSSQVTTGAAVPPSQASSSSQTPSQSSASSPSTPTSSPSSSSSSSTPSSPPPAAGAPTEPQLQAAVQNYFSLVTQNHEAAYQLLSPRFQADPDHSYAKFEAWWNQVDRVELGELKVKGNNQVSGRINYVMKSGTTSRENKTWTLVPNATGDTLLIDSER
ncbi:hypothetical protein LX83_002603 [Goodfellowiella coeruleoviolacea]|uniref:non-specific serine/threonine protein kinase n=2 Tax=Goodfellowiella coeruleoviolacea TaxID=334858 RepID=A0AAE3GCU7_9PSEU|nr:hypothetical protein [Goodfellowiella coeruleoviolacea]